RPPFLARRRPRIPRPKDLAFGVVPHRSEGSLTLPRCGQRRVAALRYWLECDAPPATHWRCSRTPWPPIPRQAPEGGFEFEASVARCAFFLHHTVRIIRTE